MYLYINSTGTTRADGETVGFETEGTAVYDTMCFVKNEVGALSPGCRHAALSQARVRNACMPPAAPLGSIQTRSADCGHGDASVLTAC